MHPLFARSGVTLVKEAGEFSVCSELTEQRELDSTVNTGPGKIRRPWDPREGEISQDLGWR